MGLGSRASPLAALLTMLGLAVPALPSATFAQWTSPALESGAPSAPGGTAPGETAPPGTEAPGAEPSQPSPCQSEPALRCPDLVMSAPFHLHLDRSTIHGHVLLRAASSIDNVGAGPIELRAHRSGGKMTVYQAIYDSSGHRHLFQTKAGLIFKYVPGRRYRHPTIEAFSYWKLRHAAGFQLWALDAEGRAVQLVRTGPKVDYCLRDLIRSHPSPGSPRARVYPACSQDPYMRSDVLGTSVGWSDVYPYEYPEQWIDVTGLHGRFAYVQVVDPENLLIEFNHANDVSETYVELPSGRVFGHRVGVAAP